MKLFHQDMPAGCRFIISPMQITHFARIGLLLSLAGFSVRAGDTARPAQDVSAKDEEICAVAAAPSGLTVLVGGENLTLVDVGAEKRIRKFSGTTGTQRAVLFSPDGQRVYSGSSKGQLHAGRVSAGEIEHKIKAHGDAINTLAISADGKWLASGGEDRQLKLWDAATLEPGKKLKLLPSTIQSAAFSPDGATLAAAGDDGAIFLYNLQTGEAPAPIASGDTINALAWSPDGKRLASAGNSADIQLWNPATGKLARAIPRQSGWVVRLAFLADGRRIASLGSDKTLRLFDAETGALIEWFKVGDDDDITALAVFADGSLATAGRDEAVKRWVPKQR